jgi:predicted RNA-binding Zn ribbon-like protein
VITQSAPGETAHPAIALANSRRHTPDGAAVDDLKSVASLRAWLNAQGLPVFGREGLAPLRELRDAVRDVLLARIARRAPARKALAAVNAAAAAAPFAPQLAWQGAPRAELSHPAVSALDQARGRIAADAIVLVTGADADDLRACEAPGCARLLLRDHPRRQWCSTRCGDRVRARRYYARHR